MISRFIWSGLKVSEIFSYNGRLYQNSKSVLILNNINYIFGILKFFLKLLSPYFVWNSINSWATTVYYAKIFLFCQLTYGVLLFIKKVLVSSTPEHQNLSACISRVQTSDKLTYEESLENDDFMELQRYDISMEDWPLIYDPSKTLNSDVQPFTYNNYNATKLTRVRYYVLYLISYYIGSLLVYPGSSKILNALQSYIFIASRRDIIKMGGYRYAIKTKFNDTVDTFFVDRRNSDSDCSLSSRSSSSTTSNEKYLIIACDGNGAYYERGLFYNIITTTNFSCLGWNYPGFSQSKGDLFHYHVQECILSVIDYAVNYLGFEEHKIVLFGWSIGGYPCSYAGQMNNNLNSLIIDASFYDLEIMAYKHAPYIKYLIPYTLKNYFNLTTLEHLKCYNGPIRFYARSEDEMMNLVENDILSNTTIECCLRLLQYRYPAIFDELALAYIKALICKEMNIKYSTNLTDPEIAHSYEKYLLQQTFYPVSSFPCDYGNDLGEIQRTELAYALFRCYLTLIHEPHCTPLQLENFQLPKIGF